jgi:hypothetical protein
MRDCIQALWWGRCACGGMRAVPRLCIKLYPGIRLTTEENHGKTSVGVAEKRLTEDCWHDSFSRLGGRFTGDLDLSSGRHHLWLAPLVTWANPWSDIYRVAGLRGSPHQLTSSRSSQSRLWCGRRKMEFPNPREFACCWCTKVNH